MHKFVDFNFHQRDRLAQICRFFYISQTFFYFFSPIHYYSVRFTPISGSPWLILPVAFPSWPLAPSLQPYFKEQTPEPRQRYTTMFRWESKLKNSYFLRWAHLF